jgi:acyl-CoA synthetase (AMP-forming)/AMP-acid ligase II
VTTLAEVVRESAARYGDKPLYVDEEGRVLSYSALNRVSDQVASGMLEHGVGAGDVVSVLVPSGFSYAVAYCAAAKIGAVTAGVNERLSEHERSKCVQVAGPRLILCADGAFAPAGDGAEVVEVDADADPDDVLANLRGSRDLPATVDERAPVAIVFTSGTTGQPKGAVFGNRQLDAVGNADGNLRWGGGGRGLSNTSFAHVGYMTKFPQSLRSGGTTYLMRRWSAGDAIELVQRHRVTTLGGIPTQMELMLRHERFGSADLSSVRLVALGGGPSTAALVRETRDRLGVPVVVRYTCTEAGVGTGTEPDAPAEDAERTVGRARPGVEVSVRDQSDRPLPPGEIGQVCLRSAAVMEGYWRDEKATTAALTADRAVRTGDVGYVDEVGRLHLTGRSKEMYVRGGYNVYPVEVEQVLADHPRVAHVAVVPRTDEVMGEKGVAVVVPRRGEAPPTLESLREHARSKLASYKLPESLVVVEELPRTPMENIDRRALKSIVERIPQEEGSQVGSK